MVVLRPPGISLTASTAQPKVGGMKSLLILTACMAGATACAGSPDSPAGAAEPLFVDVTETTGLAGVESPRVAFADFNSDGYPDVLAGYTRIFLSKRGGGFVRSPHDASLGLPDLRGPNVVQVGDVNNDGIPDLFYGRYTDLSAKNFTDDGLRSEIRIGDGRGGFRILDSSGVGRLAETTITACFVDYDRDGNLDLFVGNAYAANRITYEAYPDRLFRGLGNGRFEDVTERAGLGGVKEPGGPDSRRPTYGVTHTDWNNDGRQDLMVATYGRQWNRLWRNNGDGTFTDVAPATRFDGDADRSGMYPPEVNRKQEEPFRSNGNTFDCAVADFDNDGDMDCFLAEITHWWAGPSSDRSTLLVNRGAQEGFAFDRRPELIDRKHDTTRWNQGDIHAGWLDVDNDGLLDLLIASSDYPDDQILRLFHQRSDGTFEEWTDRLGFKWRNASQLSLGDFDRDGATDILLGTNEMRLTDEQRAAHKLQVGLFRNLQAARAGNRFINLRLAGRSIGARVIVLTGDRRQMREVRGGLGHAGHRDDADCRFGVGKADTAELVEVHWPDAARTVQRFENVQTNRFYRLEKGGTLQIVHTR